MNAQQENRLYPLKFRPIIKDKMWGGTRLRDFLNKKTKTSKAGESWEISCIPKDISVVCNGFLKGNALEELIEVYMGDLVGDSVYEKYGLTFPLLIKFIDANEALSIQVHPNDQLAEKRHQSFGKTEMWYVIEAEKDAEIIIGFSQSVDKTFYKSHLEKKSLHKILNREKAVPGDVFFLPAGRIHAIGAGILLAEIQQTSDITYRVFDFDRIDSSGKPRELHTELALDAIDFTKHNDYKIRYEKQSDVSNRVISCPYFTTNYIELKKGIDKDYNDIDSFVVYMCVDGAFDLHYYEKDITAIHKGETVLLPAEIKTVRMVPKTSARILEIYVETQSSEKRTSDVISKYF
ncbi:MAG: class I mannose-6-phosphate isomerase [Bacteroidales bacterium]|nr:class I mannose-6-phosphate isomerase [Bacteroidales bacterium]MBN2764333.1 class I mannose-6-phosphate isomerase [Bacteroidales bacterium]